MATQTLEFNAPSGLTISCKLFAVGSDTVVATQTATEKTNAKNRYSVAFTDAPENSYQLIGFVGSVGGFVNEIYDLLEETATFYPRSEQLTLSYVQTVGAVTASLGTYDGPTKAELDAAIAILRGADNDTLKTLSDQIDTISSGGGSLTQGDIDSIVAAITAVADNIQQAQAGILTAYEYTTWSQDIEDLVALTSNTDIIFVLKRRMQDADAQALLKVSRVNGLMILNGVDVSSSRSDEASITVNQSTPTGEITLLVESTAMAEVPRGKWIDGLKMLHASGDVILRQGTTIIRESAVDETS